MTVKSRLLELLEQHKGETLSGEILGGAFLYQGGNLESSEVLAGDGLPH